MASRRMASLPRGKEGDSERILRKHSVALSLKQDKTPSLMQVHIGHNQLFCIEDTPNTHP